MTAQTIGKRVGSRYVIRRALGFGGICTVYEGVHLYTSRRLAVKVLNPEYLQHEEARLRLLDEARALGIVRHPNVVEIHDAGTWDNAPYVVMELLEGRNLEGLLTSRGRLTHFDAVQVVRQVALGLGAAHRAGVVHRDVKPGNVVIVGTPIGREKATLIDFGVARLPRGSDKTTARFGNSNGVVGTPEYMAPEQAAGRSDVDGRADIYALGVVLWECLTESVPIAGNWQEVLGFHATQPPPSFRRVRPDLPAALHDIMDRCLARDPRARFPDTQALVNAIDATGFCRGTTRLLDYGDANANDFAPQPPSNALRGDTQRNEAIAPQSQNDASGTLAKDTVPDLRRSQVRGLQEARSQRDATPRAPFNGPVRVVVGGESVDVRGEDLSANGLLAIGPRGFVVGETTQVRFALPTTGDIVTANAVVRWVRGREGSARAACAIGFEFVDAPPPLRAALTNYIALMAHG